MFVYSRKGRVVPYQWPFVLWALAHCWDEQTFYSRRPIEKRAGVPIYLSRDVQNYYYIWVFQIALWGGVIEWCILGVSLIRGGVFLWLKKSAQQKPHHISKGDGYFITNNNNNKKSKVHMGFKKASSMLLDLRVGLYHGPWSGTMEDGLFFIVWFLKKSNYKAYGTLTKCKPNVDQEEWPCIRK